MIALQLTIIIVNHFNVLFLFADGKMRPATRQIHGVLHVVQVYFTVDAYLVIIVISNKS